MKATRTPNLAAFIGGGIALTGILAGLRFEGLNAYDIAQPTAALVVFAGTAGAVLISAPMSQIRQALRGFWEVLFDFSAEPHHLIDKFLAWSRVARARKASRHSKEKPSRSMIRSSEKLCAWL